jgi:hypothetical protein
MSSTTSNLKDFADSNGKRILKKLYHVSGKIIIVIDPSLVEKLGIDVENTWFQEEQVDDGILLKPSRTSN